MSDGAITLLCLAASAAIAVLAIIGALTVAGVLD